MVDDAQGVITAITTTTTGKTGDAAQLAPLLEQHQQHLGAQPKVVVGDKHYGSARQPSLLPKPRGHRPSGPGEAHLKESFGERLCLRIPNRIATDARLGGDPVALAITMVVRAAVMFVPHDDLRLGSRVLLVLLNSGASCVASLPVVLP